MNRGQRPPADGPVNVALALLAAAAVAAGLLRLAGTLATWATAAAPPGVGVADAMWVLADPLDPAAALDAPGLHPLAYWVAVTLLLAILAGCGWGVWRAVTDRSSGWDPRRLAGTATTADIARTASPRTLLRRAGNLRPSLEDPRPDEVGYLLGTARGRQVWATIEDSILLIGPPRSGKGLHLVINAICDAPGPVITTSTRPDNLTTTLRARERHGPVAVFDPQQLAPGLPAGLRWSPVRGCHKPLTAMIRATGLASATGLGSGGVDNGGFWEGKTRTAIQALLHAAALDSRDPATLYQWALNPTIAADAVRILQTSPQAATGWAESLDAMIQADPRTRDSIWQGVSLAFAALADPRVLDAITPRPGEEFDPTSFLRDNGTLYLLATGAGAGASAALVAAFIEDLVEVARTLAATSPGARLDPPLLMALDEIGNLAPLPSLPTLMAEGGGTGITTMPVLQSMAQARVKWGNDAAGAIWDASIVKLVLGGGSNSRDLQDLSALIGDRDEHTDSTSIDAYGGRSSQRSLRRVPIMPADTLRTLPFGTGLTLLRTAPPIITDLRAWTDRPDADRLTTHRDQIEALLRAAPATTTDGSSR
ncbi:MAG: type IV secretory system conjugative DNA transfer family protein [Actinobacteria bacterium]|jgi:type IV secretory pathway TraG/TraD family ATPase VirD4|nr:type IV secretory system conjugative DNA transfer family protein [Actinomycetota bacterium]